MIYIVLGSIAGGVLLLVLAALLLYYIALPKFLIKKIRTGPDPSGGPTYPPDYDAMKARVRVEKDLVYPSKYPSNEYDLYVPKAQGKFPLLVWVHGGGFIAGTKDGGENVMTALSSAGFAVAAINYSVAPEYAYPTAVRQIGEFTAHLDAIAETHPEIDTKRLFYCGDSAGAQLAAQYAAIETNPSLAADMGMRARLGKDAIKGTVLVCGPFHLPAIRAYAKPNKKFRMVVDIWGRSYFHKLRWHKSKAAMQTAVPLHVTEQYPPTFLTDGNVGSFEAQNRKLADALRQKNVPVEELYFDVKERGEIPHEYLFHLADAPSLEALEKMIAFLNAYKN